MFDSIRTHFDQRFEPSVVVDFGCGVGRLAVALSKRSARVVAVDVSKRMLEEARQNCRLFASSNVDFMNTDEFLKQPLDADLVNAFIVFQHIPVREGEDLYRSLIARVRTGGISAAHFVFHHAAPVWTKVLAKLRGTVPGAYRVWNLLDRKMLAAPQMQMNAYNLNRIFSSLGEYGYGHSYTVRTSHGGYEGLLIMAQRSGRGVP